MITPCIIGGVVLMGLLRYWQSRIDLRRRSAVFIIEEERERWVVDFTTRMMYYRYFYKVPHVTDRDLSQDYEIRPRKPWTGSGVHLVIPSLWEMRLTSKSWSQAKQEALTILERPKGSFRSVRRRAKKANKALGLEPAWEPVPPWLIEILNSRHEVYLRYEIAREEGLYANHPGRVEDLEPYLTRDGSPACSSGSKGGSRPKRYLKIYGTANSTAGRLTAPKGKGSRALVG
jgi:hypothetical protein